MTAVARLTAVRGADKSWNVTFYQSDGTTPLNITGATLYFTVKSNRAEGNATDTDAVIQKDVKSHSDPTNGETSLILTDDDTNIAAGTYYFDMWLKDLSGIKTPFLFGELEILQRVTMRA